MLLNMQRAAALAMTLALGSCVTGVGIWKRDETSLPLLVGATAADLVVTAAIASQIQDFTVAATIGTAVAVTAIDVVIGCLLGACSSLRL